MMDIPMITKIAQKLQVHTSSGLMICDASGRIVVSSDPNLTGSLNLLAIQCLNLNAPVSTVPDPEHLDQFSGTAAPLRYHNSRIGALVLPDSAPDSGKLASILSSAAEMMYEELLSSRSLHSQNQERDQFLFEWLHMQPPYNSTFQKRGERFGIDISGTRTILVTDPDTPEYAFLSPMLHKLLSPDDFMVSLSQTSELILIREQDDFEKRLHRILSLFSTLPSGLCRGQSCLNAGYQTALECLNLGRLLFSDRKCFDYDFMKTALALSHLDLPGLETDFLILKEKGSNAELAETVIAWIRCNGDIQKLSKELHLHRNSIPYRIRRIRELCGKDLNNVYDQMALYASYIRYLQLSTN